MTESKKTLKICKQGHKFYKSSSCPVCPICEKENKPTDGFLALLSAPARRALEHEGILTLQKLSKYSESEILSFHGVGPSTIPVLRKALSAKKLAFRKK